MALVEVDDLSITYATRKRPPTHAVRNVTFQIDEGEVVGLVGESGSGKSTLGNAMIRLLERPGVISGGAIRYRGRDITKLPERDLRPMRWTEISTVFQSSMNSLNPVLNIETQFRDVFEAHDVDGKVDVDARIDELFELVEIEPRFKRFYAHELSGGMRQRVALALALALRPRFVLLDEPTTGLDVVVQRQILERLRKLQQEQGFAVLLISHDLGSVLEFSDRVLVMYAGELVEEAPAAEMLRRPKHPYTRGLVGSYADPNAETIRISYIPGRPPDLSNPPKACPFTPRCPDAIPICGVQKPALLPLGPGMVACHVAHMRAAQGVGQPRPGAKEAAEGRVFVKHAADAARAVEADHILRVEHVSKLFRRRRGLKVSEVLAVDDVSFELTAGMVSALVGQSGSGKSTIAKLVTGIDRPDSGSVTFEGTAQVDRLRGKALRDYRKHIQYVFQDPYSALNPAHPVMHALVRPLMNYRGMSRSQAERTAIDLLESVGLSPGDRFAHRYPHQLSGGQRQRIVIARALAPEPKILIADEPISSLDVSIRAEILQLLDRLVRDRKIAMLYITHDLLSARLLADEIIVLNQGRIVERGPALDVIANPKDPYTQLLLRSIPNPFEEAHRAA